jgi:hypothetical protein
MPPRKVTSFGRRCLSLQIAAVVVCIVLLAGCSSGSPRRQLTLGVASDSVSDVGTFATTAGAKVGIYEWYQAWSGSPAFGAGVATAAVAHGAVPMLTWEPWDPTAGTRQPLYSLARIVNGYYDGYIAGFARQVRAWGGVLALRFLQELNGNWYPWGLGVDGNSAKEAVAAWNHVHTIFAAQGATNVVWVWCANASRPGTESFASLYPGDATVGWVALDGYNAGSALDWGGWLTPSEIFGSSTEAMQKLTRRPLIIAETGSAERGGSKAAWIRALFPFLKRSHIRALVWFDYNKETDWRIASSASSAAAFREEAGASGLLGSPPIPPDVKSLTAT